MRVCDSYLCSSIVMVALFHLGIFCCQGQVRRRYGSISSVCKEVKKLEFFNCLFIAPHVGELDHLHIGALSVSLSLCVCVCLSQLGWNVLKWNHFGLTFYLCILQCWSSNAILRILEICELIGQFEDVSEESGSMLVVQLGSLLVVDICTEDVCSFTISAPSC